MMKKFLLVLGLLGFAAQAKAAGPVVNYIQSRSTLQTGATFYVSSGTVAGPLRSSTFTMTATGSESNPAFGFAGDTAGIGMHRVVQPTSAIAAASWDTGTHNIAQTAHGLYMTSAVLLTTSGSLPTGLSLGTTYFVIWIDADHFALASTMGNADSGVKIAFTTQGSGTHTVTPVADHSLGFDANGALVVRISSAAFISTGSPKTPSQVFIGGTSQPTQPSELLHVEGTGGIASDFSADMIVYNTSPHAGRVIASTVNSSHTVTSYIVAYGSSDNGSFWSGSPDASNSAEVLLQNGAVQLFRSLAGGTSTFFYNDQATSAQWLWNFGASGTQVFKISEKGVEFYPRTKAQMAAIPTVTATPTMLSCSDCSRDNFCVSTGTINSFVAISSRTLACQ